VPTEQHFSHGSAAQSGLLLCHHCGKTQDMSHSRCVRCDSPVHVRNVNSIQKTWAYLITAFVLYLPANLLPIMSTTLLGKDSSNTILSGIVALWEHGSYPIALIIFIASVLIPIAKLLVLCWLCYMVQNQSRVLLRERTLLYRITEFIGRWSMIDVFVVGILVSLVHLGNLMTIYPGPAALSFAGMVVATMLAANSFDPRLIWDVYDGE
jgi:paraquat-inducible protein A